MAFDKITDQIINYVRTGRGDSPYKEIQEALVIDSSGKVQLTEYPSPYHKVIVTGDGREWFETKSITPNVNSYYVDYNHKMVTFNIANVGKQLEFYYQGMGGALISAKNIYVSANGGEVTETLHGLTSGLTEIKDEMIQAKDSVLASEIERQSNESTRLSNETTRSQDETTRITNENNRKNSENTRIANENERISNENQRKLAETSRVNAESLRVTAEEIREQNEDEREVAESTRLTNETTRQTNETTRQSNEVTRQETLSQMNTIVYETKFREPYSTTTQYKKNNIVSFNGSSYMAKKDNINNPPPLLPVTENEYWGMLGRKGQDADATVGIYKDTFVATEGQKVFTLSNNYDQYQNRTHVLVDWVVQSTPDNYTESSQNTITLAQGVPAGTIVEVKYFGNVVPLTDDVRTVVTNHTTEINNLQSNKIGNITYQTFTSTANQSVFNLTTPYVVGKNRLKVYVEGILQLPPNNFTETSSTRFTLSESLPAGLEVVAEIMS